MLLGALWDSTVQFPPTVNLILYIVLWIIALAGLAFVFTRGRAAGFNMRWTTQDILVLAVMGVLLEVYDRNSLPQAAGLEPTRLSGLAVA